MYLKQLLQNPTLNSNALRCSVVNGTSCWLQVPLTAPNTVCCIQNVTKQRVSCSNLYAVDQRFSNFFQVGTTFISQNDLRTTILLGLSNSLGLP